MRPDMGPWFALALLVPLLYWFRRRPRKIRVSTLPFFQALAREHSESPWLRKLKKWLSLLLNLGIVLSILGALAQPLVRLDDSATHALILLVDRSASMSSQLSHHGPTRLDSAIQVLRQRLEALPDDVPVALLAFDRRTEVLSPFESSRTQLIETLMSIRPIPAEDRFDRACAMAQRMIDLHPTAVVWAVSDQTRRPPEGFNPQRWLSILPKRFPPVDNLGITAFDLRPTPLGQGNYQVYARVQRSMGADPAPPRPFRVEVKLEGRVGSVRKFELAPGGSEELVFDLEASGAELVELRIVHGGDALMMDDAVASTLPQKKPLGIFASGGNLNPAVHLAMGGLIEAGDLAWCALPDEADILICEGTPPPDGTTASSLWIHPDLSHSGLQVGPKSPTVEVSTPKVLRDSHPLLFGVDPRRLRLLQDRELVNLAGYQTLWQGTWGPLLLAAEEDGRRHIVLAFDPVRSPGLLFDTAWPQLVANAMAWLEEPLLQRSRPEVLPCGTLYPLGREGLRWIDPDKRESTAELSSNSPSTPWVQLSRQGLFEAGQRKGSSWLLSRQETQEAGGQPELPADVQFGATWAVPGPWVGPWARFLLGLSLVLLLTEIWLFHRWTLH